MQTLHYSLNNVEEIFELSMELAAYFPDAINVQLGIYELLLNAIEHGNLAIDHAMKLRLLREDRWHDEVKRRLTLPEHASKQVSITLQWDDTQCCVTIADQGNGFDWRQYMAPDDFGRERTRGLGLLMVRHAGFDAIEFNDSGNEVTCRAIKCRN